MTRPRLHHLIAGALVLAAAAAPIFAQSPATQISPAEALAAQRIAEELPKLDSARLIRDLYALAADSMEGRGIGTRGSARARAWLTKRITEIGLMPLGASLEVPFKSGIRGGREVAGTNLLMVIRGTKLPDQYIVLSAHYDHVGVLNNQVHPGADDNASGAVTVLAIAKWLKDHPPTNSVIIALFDGEENGMLGSKAFVESGMVPLDRILANVNLDMVSRSSQGELYAAGGSKHREFRPLLDAASAVAPVKLKLGHDDGTGQGNWSGQSDHAAFDTRNIPWIYLGVEDHPDYHKPTDRPSRVDLGFFFRSATTIAELVRLLDTAPPALVDRAAR